MQALQGHPRLQRQPKTVRSHSSQPNNLSQTHKMMTTLRYTQLTLMHKCALDANAILLLIFFLTPYSFTTQSSRSITNVENQDPHDM
jgi:hypothetical protein